MAENLGASFSIDVTNLKAGLKTANAMIRESESEFRKAAAGMDDWSKSQEGLEAKIKSLNDIAKIQRDKVEALKKEYDKLVKEGLDPTSDKAVKLRTNINNEETALAKTETELTKNRTALQNLATESDKATGEVKELTDQTKDGTDKFGAMDIALGNLVSMGISAAIQGFKDLAKFAGEAYKEVDAGADAIVKATGATGTDAALLEESYKNVAKEVKGDFETIGAVLGEVNTRFGYTGTNLEDATKQFLKFADITGTDAKTAVGDVSKALKAAGMNDKEYTTLLDQMTVASQKSGVSVSKLTEGLTKNGATFRSLGFDTKNTIAILAQWEAAGVNTETAMKGLQTASRNWAKDGKDAREEFEKAMQDLANSPSDVERSQKAIEIFGSKAGPELADAVKTGRTEYGSFVDDLEKSQGVVNTTYEQTQDAFDKVAIKIQDVKTQFYEFVSDLLEEYGPELEQAFSIIGDAIKTILGFAAELLKTLEKIFGWIAKLGQTKSDWITGDDKFRKLVEEQAGKNFTDEEWKTYLSDNGVKLARGGIVHGATQAIIGEHGAEVVMPLENNTEWIDKLAEKLGGRGGVNVYQTNNYAQAHSRYELWQSEKNIQKAVKAAVR